MGNRQTDNQGILTPEFLSKLDRLVMTAKRVQLGLAKGERRSKRKGVSLEFADYRDYVQGDELRHVDWNIFGRLESLCLKLFQDHEDLTLHLLIDASTSMGFGTPPKIEFACKLAAALGYIALAGTDRVSVAVFSGPKSQTLGPLRGKTSARKLFTFLQEVRAEGATYLDRSTYSHLLQDRARGIQLIISDFFDDYGFEGCLKRLCSSGSDAHAVHVLAPEEMAPQVSGDLKLVDSETGGFVEVSITPALMKRYHEDRERFCESLRRFCVGRGMGHFLTASDMPVEQFTLELLRKGGLLR